MSFFRNDPSELDLGVLERVDPACRVEDQKTDEAVAEGVVVRRRSLFGLGAGAVAGLLAATRAPARSTEPVVDPEDGPFDFQQFLEHVLPMSRRQVGGAAGEDTYMMSVAAALTRLVVPGSKIREQMNAFSKANGVEGKRFPLRVVEMQLKEGKGFAHHDHRDYNGIIFGLEGECRIRNFDILGDVAVPPKGETFQIRETRDDLILPGRFSMLQRRAENVHDLVAGAGGCRVLDVFTFYERGARSYFLDVEDKPRDAERRVYDAGWR